MKQRWAFYSSLNDSAKAAFDKGNGKHGKFIVDGKHLIACDEHGVAVSRMLIVKGTGQVFEEQTCI